MGLKATGTGIIVEQKTLARGELGEVKGEVNKRQFAMGAEPQIRSKQFSTMVASSMNAPVKLGSPASRRFLISTTLTRDATKQNSERHNRHTS